MSGITEVEKKHMDAADRKFQQLCNKVNNERQKKNNKKEFAIRLPEKMLIKNVEVVAGRDYHILYNCTGAEIIDGNCNWVRGEYFQVDEQMLRSKYVEGITCLL